MSTQAKLTFSLPDNVKSNRVRVYTSTTRDSSFSLLETKQYRYGETDIDIDIDSQLWYRVRFFVDDDPAGPYSEPVYGGTVTSSSPFLAVSSTYDGAHYATAEEVYEYAGLTSEDVSEKRVNQALRRARALIDWRTAEMDLDRLDHDQTDIKRRKYNAALRILKEAEINFTLGTIYQNMSDDLIMKNRREGDDIASGGTAIGGASVGGDNLSERSENIRFLAELSDRYFATGNDLLMSIQANSVRILGSDLGVRMPRFRHPFSTRRGTLRLQHWR